ncbi:MAG: glycoside hydrolase family 18 protein [Parachlamydiaceae bacterium]|nr:glycoside hydrolase family 18 protein [Parachlamydiaceae bacterium]
MKNKPPLSIKNIFYILTLLLLINLNLFSSDYKVVGYYPNWAIYRNPAFKPHEIDPSLFTHINYAFSKVDTQGNIILFDPWADIEWRNDWQTEKPFWGNFRVLADMKKKHPHLKTLISIGGWTLSDTFSELASNPKARKNFAKNIVKFCKQYEFDGVDLDWEYPGFADHSGRPEDKKNFTLLLAEIHTAIKAVNPPLLLTIAAPAGPFHYKNMEVAHIHKYLDWLNLMTYDFHEPWPNSDTTVTNHNAPLYPPEHGPSSFAASEAINYYLSQGVPPEKLLMGLALYGRSFSGVGNVNDTGLHNTYTGPGSATTQEVGMRFFYDIKQNLLNTYQLHWDERCQVPYLYHPQKKEFISFDNETSLQIKCQFIKKMNLGGAMVWELTLDQRPGFDAMRAITNELNE